MLFITFYNESLINIVNSAPTLMSLLSKVNVVNDFLSCHKEKLIGCAKF